MSVPPPPNSTPHTPPHCFRQSPPTPALEADGGWGGWGGASDRQPLTNPSSTPRVAAGARGSRLALRAGRQPVTLPCDRSRARGNPPWGPWAWGRCQNGRPRRAPPALDRRADGRLSVMATSSQAAIDLPAPTPHSPSHLMRACVWRGAREGGGRSLICEC